MTSIFQRSRQEPQQEPIHESSPVFKQVKKHRQEQIIPPIGLAAPELVESFMENFENEEKIKRDIQDLEAYKNESGFDTAKRETGSYSARLAEGFLGGINSLLNAISPDLELEDEGTGEVERHKPTKLPETQELREFTKEKTGKYLEPKTEFAKAAHETVSDIGTSLTSAALTGPWAAVLLPVGGQITKQAIKASGGDEKAQEWGKLGFMTLSTIAQFGNAPRVARQAIARSEQMLPQGLRFSARPTEQALAHIRSQPWYRTGRTAAKGPAFDEIERIEQQIQNGTLDAHTATQLRRDINTARGALGGFLFRRDPNRAQALAHLDEVDRALIASMENYGRNVNPTWWNQYQRANEAFRVTQRSQALSQFIEKNAKPLQSQMARTLFRVGGSTLFHAVPGLAAIAAPAAAGAKTIQIMNRMIRSPVLRNHYIEVLNAAAAGNAANTKKALRKFDITAENIEKKENKKEKGLQVKFDIEEEDRLNKSQ